MRTIYCAIGGITIHCCSLFPQVFSAVKEGGWQSLPRCPKLRVVMSSVKVVEFQALVS